MSPVRRLVLPLLAALGALALVAAPAAATVEVTAKPGLRPGFDKHVHDYVIRCPANKRVRVFVHASNGDRVSVAGSRRRGGHFERRVKRATDASFPIRVRSHTSSTTYHVRCLPSDFPDWSFQSHGRAQAQWYVIEPNSDVAAGYIAIFNKQGVPVWWWHSSSYGPWDGKLLPGHKLAWAHFYHWPFGVLPKDAYDIRRLDGTLVRKVKTVGNPIDTHELQRMPDGDYLAFTYRRRCCTDLRAHGGPKDAEYFDGEIQRLTPSGKLVWKWSAYDHFGTSWTTGDSQQGWWAQQIHDTPLRPSLTNAYDLFHLNSIEIDGDGLIVSARHLDAVFRIELPSGDVDWKLGGTYVAGKSLAVVGPHPNPLFSGQHDARLWKDGTLTVHDNRSWPHQTPLADRFKIDPVARTARLIEHVSDPEVTYSPATGSARKLPGGNWVAAWGDSPLVTEQKPDGTIVRRFEFSDGRYTYRAVPLVPGQLSASRLRRGMDKVARAQR